MFTLLVIFSWTLFEWLRTDHNSVLLLISPLRISIEAHLISWTEILSHICIWQKNVTPVQHFDMSIYIYFCHSIIISHGIETADSNSSRRRFRNITNLINASHMIFWSVGSVVDLDTLLCHYSILCFDLVLEWQYSSDASYPKCYQICVLMINVFVIGDIILRFWHNNKYHWMLSQYLGINI